MFIVSSTKQCMLDRCCSIPKCLITHLSYPSVFVSRAPHAIIVKTKRNQLQGSEVTLLKVLHLKAFLGIDERLVLEAQNPVFKPCHFICQLGLSLDSVDGVKTMVLEQIFRLSYGLIKEKKKKRSGCGCGLVSQWLYFRGNAHYILVLYPRAHYSLWLTTLRLVAHAHVDTTIKHENQSPRRKLRRQPH